MSDFERATNDSNEFDDELENALASFTDDLLDGKIELEEAESSLSEDEELRKLQAMVLRMHRAYGSDAPSPAMSSRIKMNLVTELRKMDFEKKEAPNSIWSRLRALVTGGRRLNVLMPVAAIAAVFVIVLAVVLTQGTNGDNILGTLLDPPSAYPVPEQMGEISELNGLSIRVSVDSNGAEVDNDSWYSAISADGRYIAFVSASDELVNDDNNGVRDVFVHDQNTGSTERVSLGDGGQEGNGDSLNPAISADGRFVAFESRASNLVSGDGNNARDIFVRDLQNNTTEMVSIVNGQSGNGDSRHPSISNDGRYVTFYSTAPNLAANDGNGVGDIFLFDRQVGTLTAVSVTSGGQVGDGESRNPAISGNGQFVAFESLASNLVDEDGNSASDIFLYSLQNGSLERVSVNPDNEEGDGHSYNPDLSDDGGYVAFQSQAENLWEGDSNGHTDIFVYYRSGNQINIDRASVANMGGQANDDSGYPSISADGRYVAFSSFANNLAGGEIYGGNLDIYVFDRDSDVMERISADQLGQEPDGASVNPDISADGRFISFDSTASNLVNDDNNGRVDVFLRDRTPPVSVDINYATGSPGSFFTVTGSRFLPESDISLVVNGTNIGNVTTDANGSFIVVLATTNADLGGYILRANGGTLNDSVGFFLDQNSAVRPQEGEGAIFNIPSGIAYTYFNTMPATFGN